MADNEDDRDSLAPHPFGMPEETTHRRTITIVMAVAVAVVLLLAVGTGAMLLRPKVRPKPTPPPAAQTGTSPTGSAEVSASSVASGSVVASNPSGAAGTATLPTLQTPPEHTVAMIVVPRGFAGADFSVAFEPLGFGPAGSAGGLLMAKVLSSKPVGSAAASLQRDFSGRNVSLYCTPGQLTGMATGARYDGTIHVRPQGDVGVLILTQADRHK